MTSSDFRYHSGKSVDSDMYICIYIFVCVCVYTIYIFFVYIYIFFFLPERINCLVVSLHDHD